MNTQVSSSTVPRRSARALVIMVVCLAFYTFLDLASKEWALDTLSQGRTGDGPAVCMPDPQGYLHMQRVPTEAKSLIPGYLGFHYAENCGAAFGMLRTAPSYVRAIVFGVAALGACVVLISMFVKGAGGPLFGIAVPFILSGAIGNLSDRIRHGFVVDFIQVDPNWFEYPTFNVADIAIAVGVGLLLIDGVKKPQAQPSAVNESA